MSGTTPNYGFPLEISGCLNCTLGWFNTTAPTLIVAGSKNTNTSGINDAIVPLYVVIFLLSVVGNSMVMVTLIQNKRMRTVTNVYLLNLAISDLLLGVFCMPFTLLGQILRNFVFGGTMCKLIPYFQAVSVSVGVWTLVAISLERYFAICRPLKSRRWQTQFHAYKMIVVVWLASLTWTSPILLVSTLQSTQRKGRHKCREVWPSIYSERTYNIFLDMVLLLVPLLIMSIAYSLIVSKLWRGLQREMKHNSSFRKKGDTLTVPAMSKVVVRKNTVSTVASGIRPNRLLPKVSNLRQRTTRATYKCKGRKGARLKLWLMKARLQSQLNSPLVESQLSTGAVDFSSNSGDEETSYKFSRQAIRSNYMEKSIDAKKKVIRMLFVIITEFFVCWAPIHVLNTWYLFSPKSVYQYVGSTGISLVQLLAYISSCCNPITYCFMNRKFRQAFLAIFRFRSQCFCRSENKPGVNGCPMSRLGEGCIPLGANNSDVSVNDSTVYVGRACASEVVVLDAEECV